ncbi:MAG TPA: fused MFS/spermidine synthase, partial [Gemmatimonadaceae bacterium]|nr:fused MFS/spermidine synthase [Gemmatimonadaceae bacterium]
SPGDRLVIRLLYAIFFLSGAAGLIYESIWSRYLGLFVGHSAYAQVLVLVIFLGGMSLGAWLAGRRSERVREPLLWYAGIEIAIGVIGIVFHDVFLAVTTTAYDAVFPAAGGAVLAVAKWGLAGAMILPQSVLLGATFPLMSAGVLRRAPSAPGRVISLLYFSNSLGAAVGVLVSGFYLVRAAGLPGALLAAAILNLVAGLAVMVAARAGRVRAAPADALAAAPGLPAIAPAAAVAGAAARLSRRDLRRLALAVAAGTAVASFIYEIAWIRMLSLVLGSATHSFELMLSAFILGLALGAFWVRRRSDAFTDPVRALGIVQWVMGALALATLPVYVASFGWTASLVATLAPSEGGYRAFTIARYAISLAVMLPATFCAGMTLPLITRTLLAAGAGERAIGDVYAVNTLGSIAGAALAGLVLLPWLGVKGLLITGAVVDMSLGVALLALSARAVAGRRPLARAAVAATVLLTVGIGWRVPLSRSLLASGVYRTGVVWTPDDTAMVYYRDGRTATVSVRRSVRADGAQLSIATNGKPDASLGPEWFRTPEQRRTLVPLREDATTQALLPLVTLAHAPEAAAVAVIGHGSGMTSTVLLGASTVREVATVEIEPRMIEASRHFLPANRRVFEDPRSRFVIDDAKSYFAAAGRRFDAIISEPSNPWVSGVSGLFTREFYGRVRRYLAPGGVFGQWLHTYELSDDLALGVVAAIHETFPAYAVYQVSYADLLIVATNDSTLPAPDWSVLGQAGVRETLAGFIPLEPWHLDGMWIGDRRVLGPLVERHGVANSDFSPTLDLGAERTRYLRRRAAGFERLGASRFDVAAALAGRRRGPAPSPALPTTDIVRLRRLALGARLHDTAQWTDVDVGAPRFRAQALAAVMASGRPPEDWRRWVALVTEVEADRLGGTAGATDDAFFGGVDRYAARHGAPAGARAALDFLRGTAAWDWPRVAAASDALLGLATAPTELWIAPEVLLDGAVLAKLALGDAAGARGAFTKLHDAARSGNDELRLPLLEAHIAAAERRGRQLAR